MEYVPQKIMEIHFEGSLFVTTGLDDYDTPQVRDYIKSRGGIIRYSVTESTNYLIYQDGKEETTNYKKAME